VFEHLEARLSPDGKLRADGGGETAPSKNEKSQTGMQDGRDQNSQGERAEAPSSNSPNGNTESRQAQSGKPGEGKSTAQSDADSQESQNEGKQSDQAPETQRAEQSGDLKQQSNGGQQNGQGLMDKMRDALNSLMAKMRQDPAQQNRNNTASDQTNPGSQAAAKAQGQQQDARSQNAGQDQSSEGQNQAQASERTQGSRGRSSDATPEKGADAHSGIGRQDGDKSLKEAEQLQAMGKLAEIIGKRSASLTGEMTVETPSNNQQLKTAYSQKVGQHTDAGGEINRDEVPVADQQYVRTYMELVRKQAKSSIIRP
jgi:hypothetical protein